MPTRPLRVGLNVFATDSYRAAAGPLFAAGAVDALEWDLDEAWGADANRRRPLPQWIDSLLDLYADDDALYGHAVWFSFLSARWEPRQERWLAQLKEECARRPYRHLTEHFGFHSTPEFSRGTMFPLPQTAAALRIGHDRLRRLIAASGLPVGLENTAAVLSAVDATTQGAFLEQLLAPSQSFLLLDVHNLWTQSRNLQLPFAQLLDSYPLARVRELHIAGGAWIQPAAEAHKGRFRLDSHDGPVPADAFALLPSVLARCPNAEVIFLEHRGANLDSEADFAQYQADFWRLRELVEAHDAAA